MVYYSIKREYFGTSAYLLASPEPRFTGIFSALKPGTVFYTYAAAKHALRALIGRTETPADAKYTTVKIYDEITEEDMLKCAVKQALCGKSRR